MASNRRSEALTSAYQLRLRRIAEALAGGLGVVWNQLPTPSAEATEQWLRVVVPLVLAAQRQAVNLSDAYVATYITAEIGRRAGPVGIDPAPIIGVRARGGTPLERVYARPVGLLSAAMTAGKTMDEALRTERWRLDRDAQTDVSLAARSARRELGMTEDEIVGYRRVVSGGCALCASFADSFHRADDFMPIHPGCNCGGEPVLRDEGRNRPESPVVEDIPSRAERAEQGERVARVVNDSELGPLLEAITN